VGLTQKLFLTLLAAVGASRLGELVRSQRNRRWLIAHGARPAPDPGFAAMAALHAGILVGAAAEVLLLRRPFLLPLAVPMTALFFAALSLRWWAIRTLARHWNVRVVDSTLLGVVTRGPYRWIRHPNYAGVFVEMMALPLLHTAWLTALAGTLAHWAVLRRRISAEEAVLFANPTYRAAMAGKPRFLPRWFCPSPAHREPSCR